MNEVGRSIAWVFLMLPMVFGAAIAHETRRNATHDQAIIQIDTSAAVERFPDVAEVRLGVSGDAPDDETALARNNENVLRILAVIREAGVPAKDIEQKRSSIRALHQARIEGGREQLGVRAGFRATTYITLTLRNMTSAGTIIQAVIRAGANLITQIEFQLTSERRAEARADARAAAIAFAERLARQSAQAAGGSGVDLISVGEPPSPEIVLGLAGLPPPDPLGRSAEVLIIEPGKIAVSEKVRATFRLAR
jgi:uncharacterized protein